MSRRNRLNRANFNETATVEDHIQYLDDLLEETLERIDEAEDITDEEADELTAQAEEDYLERIAQLEAAYEAGEIESEEDYEEDDGADYEDGTDLATFASSVADSPIAATLIGLGAQVGYESVEDLAVDLADGIGLDIDHAIGLLTGEFVPDEELAGAIAEGFGLDDDDYNDFIDLAAEVAATAEDDDDEGDEVGYSRYDYEQAGRIAQLEQQIAEFQTSGAISSELIELERTARLGVEEGWLPPVARDAIMGNFEMHEDRVASFSQVCNANQVSPDVELYAMRKQLEAFKQIGPIWAQFGAIVQEPLTEREVREEEAVYAQAARNHELRKKNGRVRTNLTQQEGDK